MRVVVHGQQAFGRAVLERLLAQNENVALKIYDSELTDGAVLVKRVRAGGDKIPATQYAADHNLKVGDQLG